MVENNSADNTFERTMCHGTIQVSSIHQNMSYVICCITTRPKLLINDCVKQGFWWVAEKKVKFRGDKFAEKNGWFRGNFAGILEASFDEKRLGKNGRFRGSFPSKFRWKAIGFALIWGKFSMKLAALIDLLRLHTAIWKRTLQVSLLNLMKTNKRIRILKTHLP